MGFTRRSVTCLFSSCCSQWSESLHRFISTHQQSQNIDLVAGDFNGTAWRCRSRDNISTIDEVFSDCALPTPPGTTPLWRPGSIPNNWADVCGFLKPLDPSDSGRLTSMAHSLSLDKLLV